MVQHPILAYPSSDKNAASFAYYTGQDLDEMINQAVNVLMNDGFQPVSASIHYAPEFTFTDCHFI
jgi:hypothetical protein